MAATGTKGADPAPVDPAATLSGEPAIARHLGTTSRAVAHLHRQRRIPTYVVNGVTTTSVAALDAYLATMAKREGGGS